MAGSERADYTVRPRRSLAAKTSADKQRHNPYVFRLKAEQRSNTLAVAENTLRSVVEGKFPCVLPHRNRCVRLKRRMGLKGCGVRRFHSNVCRGQCFFRDAALAFRGIAGTAHFLGHIGGRAGCSEGDRRLLDLIVNRHTVRRLEGGFQAFRHGDCDGLIAVEDPVVLQHLQGAICGRLRIDLPRVFRQLEVAIVCQYGKRSGHLLRGADIDRSDTAFRNSARN